MNDVNERLLADLRWRMTPAAGRHRLSRQEASSWGAAALPWPSKMLGGCLLSAVSLGLFIATGQAYPAIGAVFLVLMFIGIPLSFWLSGYVQRSMDVAAYRKRLEANERFGLVEYSQLLTRHIEMAKANPALGGTKEVQRLLALRARIIELVNSGTGLTGGPQSSALSEEAQLAESVLESYALGDSDDGLKELDARLPDELRAKLIDVDREAQAKSGKIEE